MLCLSIRSKIFGNLNAHSVFINHNSMFIYPDELNKELIANKVKKF